LLRENVFGLFILGRRGLRRFGRGGIDRFLDGSVQILENVMNTGWRYATGFDKFDDNLLGRPQNLLVHRPHGYPFPLMKTPAAGTAAILRIPRCGAGRIATQGKS
jgi:hypothetical protein